MIRKTILRQFGLVLLLLILAASPAVGAGSFSNSLSGFTGDSTQVATQNALAAAGFKEVRLETKKLRPLSVVCAPGACPGKPERTRS